MTAEQSARDLLERMGIEDAQSMTAGDVVEIANMVVEQQLLKKLLEKSRQYISLARRDADHEAMKEAEELLDTINDAIE